MSKAAILYTRPLLILGNTIIVLNELSHFVESHELSYNAKDEIWKQSVLKAKKLDSVNYRALRI